MQEKIIQKANQWKAAGRDLAACYPDIVLLGGGSDSGFQEVLNTVHGVFQGEAQRAETESSVAIGVAEPPVEGLVAETVEPSASASLTVRPDLDEITKALHLLHAGVIELRVPGKPTFSGYYDSYAEAAKDAFEIGLDETTKKVYNTLQELNVHPEHINVMQSSRITTKDEQVSRYRWLLIDADPVRQGVVSSTDAEKARAWVLIQQVHAFLVEQDISPILADSGNGYHLLVRIELAAAHAKLVQDILLGLDEKFSTDEVLIDTSVYNPSRICTLYGTVARKGKNTDERPWRLSKIIEIPAAIQPLAKEALVAFYAILPKPTNTESGPVKAHVPLTGTGEEKLKQFIDSIESIPHGNHDKRLTSLAGTLRQTFKFEIDEINEHLVSICEDKCVGYGDDYKEMCLKIARSIGRKPIKPERVVLVGGVKAGTNPVSKSQTATLPTPAAPALPAAQQEYAMSEDAIEAELDKPYPRIMLTEPAGPTWNDSILYGPAGQVAKLMAEYNEGHPAGIYLNLLVSLGNAFGRHARFRIGPTRHFTNEFLANVGQSSYGRKGSARDAVNDFLKIVDPEWAKTRTLSGFGSGEAIINEVRDDFQQTVAVKQKGKPPKFETVVVPGVQDKRLCIRESELATVFTMAGKKESLAGSIIRNGWDGNPLSNNVKGKTVQGLSLSARCEEPHISISGDISPEELKASLPDGSENNGFGNRFLFCYVHRTKKCPNGGPDIDWSPWLVHFHAVIEHAQQVEYVPLSKSAEKVWARMYMTFDEASKRDDMTAKMTSRGAAHVRRLAMIFALIDLSETVETEHLHAAKDIWDYCEDSARYIFGGTTRDQMKLLDWVIKTGPVTAAQVREELYKRHKKADWVRVQLNELVRQGHLTADGETYKPVTRVT